MTKINALSLTVMLFALLIHFVDAMTLLTKYTRQVAIISSSLGLFGTNIAPALAANPQFSTQIFGLSRDGRLLPCQRESNCYSTSSIKDVERYTRPWTFTGDADDAWNTLKHAIKTTENLKIVEIDDIKRYIHAVAKSAIPPSGIDDIEFLMSTTNPSDKLVMYRTNSRELIRIPGLSGTQVVPDGGSQKNRLDAIKRHLGNEWTEMGLDHDNQELQLYLNKMNSKDFFQKNFGYMRNDASEINFLDNSVSEPVK